MKARRLLLLLAIPALILLAASAHAGRAGPGNNPSGVYELTWSTLDGGGVQSAGGSGFSLDATIGQPDASAPQEGGGYSLTGGFWAGVPQAGQVYLYLPAIRR